MRSDCGEAATTKNRRIVIEKQKTKHEKTRKQCTGSFRDAGEVAERNEQIERFGAKFFVVDQTQLKESPNDDFVQQQVQISDDVIIISIFFRSSKREKDYFDIYDSFDSRCDQDNKIDKADNTYTNICFLNRNKIESSSSYGSRIEREETRDDTRYSDRTRTCQRHCIANVDRTVNIHSFDEKYCKTQSKRYLRDSHKQINSTVTNTHAIVNITTETDKKKFWHNNLQKR